MIILVDRNLISSKLFLRWIDLWGSLLGVGTCCLTRWTYWSTVYNLSEINLREWITGAGVLWNILGFLTKIICENFCGIKNYMYICKRNKKISKFIIKLKLKTLWIKLSKRLFSLSYWLCGYFQSARQIVCLRLVVCIGWWCSYVLLRWRLSLGCAIRVGLMIYLIKMWRNELWIRMYVFQRVVLFTIAIQDQSSRMELWIAVRSICAQSIARR